MASMTGFVARWNVPNSKRCSVPSNERLDRGLARIRKRAGLLEFAVIPRKKVNREDTYDEGAIERHLRREVLKRGGACKKMKTGENGWPDRTVLWRPGITHFIELKRPKGGRFEPLQQQTHAWLRGMGFVCAVLNTKAQVDEYIRQCSRTITFRISAK